MSKWILLFFIGITVLFYRSARAAGFVEKMGDVFTIAIPAYALGLSMNDSDWDGTIQLAESYAASTITTSILQPAIAERRPNGGHNGFPSGHATSAFSGAAFIRKRYGWRKSVVPYILAGFTGYSRVQSKWHYTHDVLGGWAVAELWNWMLVDSGSPYKFGLAADSDGAKLIVNVKF